MSILITFNSKEEYDAMVKPLPFNREPKKRKTLEESMQKYGWRGAISLVRTKFKGKEQIYCADGHNRAWTACKMKITFKGLLEDEVFTDERELVKYVGTLNNTQDKWKIENHCKGEIFIGNKDYIILERKKKETKLPWGTTACVLSGHVRSGSSGMGRVMQDGLFKVRDEQFANSVFDFVGELSQIYTMKSRMILALNIAMIQDSNFNKQKFKANYLRNIETIKSLKLDDYLDLFLSWI